jgi:hypothetical protein
MMLIIALPAENAITIQTITLSRSKSGCRLLIGRSHQAHGQRELNVVVSALITVSKILEKEGDVSHLQIAAAAQFVRHVLGNVFRPTFSSIERNDANRIAVLSGEEILNDRF